VPCCFGWFFTLRLLALDRPFRCPDKGNDLMVGVKIYTHEGLERTFCGMEFARHQRRFVSPDLAASGPVQEAGPGPGDFPVPDPPRLFQPRNSGQIPVFTPLTERGERARVMGGIVCPTRRTIGNAGSNGSKPWSASSTPTASAWIFIRYFVFWETVYPERTLDSIATAASTEAAWRGFKRTGIISLPPGVRGTAAAAK